jgi:hypothetical protein
MWLILELSNEEHQGLVQDVLWFQYTLKGKFEFPLKYYVMAISMVVHNVANSGTKQ